MNRIYLLVVLPSLVTFTLRSDTIELKTGERIDGVFKQATAAGAVIEVGGQAITIALEKLKAIYFGSAPSVTVAAPSTSLEALDALKAAPVVPPIQAAPTSALDIPATAPAIATAPDRTSGPATAATPPVPPPHTGSSPSPPSTRGAAQQITPKPVAAVKAIDALIVTSIPDRATSTLAGEKGAPAIYQGKLIDFTEGRFNEQTFYGMGGCVSRDYTVDVGTRILVLRQGTCNPGLNPALRCVVGQEVQVVIQPAGHSFLNGTYEERYGLVANKGTMSDKSGKGKPVWLKLFKTTLK